MIRFVILLMSAALFLAPLSTIAQEETPPSPVPERAPGEPMTIGRLEAIVRVLDPEAVREETVIVMHFPVRDVELTAQIIADADADRMRVVSGIVEEERLSQAHLRRVMQANFDSALDARYAIAQGYLWSTFIHPLGSLSDEEFLSGISQTLSLVATFGTTYSSGSLVFGGGDSEGIYQELLDEYRERTEPET